MSVSDKQFYVMGGTKGITTNHGDATTKCLESKLNKQRLKFSFFTSEGFLSKL